MSAWQNDGNEITGKVLAVAGIFAVLALAIGFAVGMFLGRSTAPTLPTLAGQVHQNAAAIQAQLEPAKAKYDASVPTGTIEDPAAYAEAQERITRAKAQLAAEHASYEAMAPGAYLRAVTALDALAVAASTPVPAAEFDRLFAAALAAIGVLAGQ
jgi:hypothetical protein